MPIRTLILTAPDSFGATVTLEELGTGRVIELRDSVFRFSDLQDPDEGSRGACVHDFWTTERIEPGAAYRFSASLNGEEPAEAMVEIPGDYETEVWISQVRYVPDYLRVAGLKYLPFLSANTHFYNRCGSGIDSIWTDVPPAQEGVHLIPIEKAEVVPVEGCGRPGIEKRELWVVGSEAEWPSGDEYSPRGLAVTERASNITNAVGFLGGILTRTIPYENCEFQGGGAEVPDHCVLQYDGEAATLRGIVRGIRCRDGPIDSVTVELREIDGEPPATRRIRSTLTNRGGAFEIGALEAGVRYAVRVRAKPEPDPFWGEVDVYTIHTDTLDLTTGEEAEHDVGLERLTSCGGADRESAGIRVLGLGHHPRLALVVSVAAVCFVPLPAASQQPAAIQGIVADSTTGRPLEDVAVTLMKDEERAYGTFTDRNEFYQILEIDPGTHALRGQLMGYQGHEEVLVLAEGERRTVNVRLKETAVELEGIVVSPERGAAVRDLGRQVVSPANLRVIPVSGGLGDLATYLQTLPGVTTTGDRGGQLFVRGGTPADNLVLVDGTPIYQPFHILGFFSVFPEESVSTADLYPGGFGARDHGRTSSVLDVRIRDGDPSGPGRLSAECRGDE